MTMFSVGDWRVRYADDEGCNQYVVLDYYYGGGSHFQDAVHAGYQSLKSVVSVACQGVCSGSRSYHSRRLNDEDVPSSSA